jgi:hypothetical protein
MGGADIAAIVVLAISPCSLAAFGTKRTYATGVIIPLREVADTLVTYKLAAPRSSSNAEAMMAR